MVSGILHLMLVVVRGGDSGFKATFRVVSYSQAAQAWGLIPFVGGWIGGVWQFIVQIIGLRQIHKTSYVKVVIAFAIPAALVFLMIMAVAILIYSYLGGL
jgi:hypothetical protein